MSRCSTIDSFERALYKEQNRGRALRMLRPSRPAFTCRRSGRSSTVPARHPSGYYAFSLDRSSRPATMNFLTSSAFLQPATRRHGLHRSYCLSMLCIGLGGCPIPIPLRKALETLHAGRLSSGLLGWWDTTSPSRSPLEMQDCYRQKTLVGSP